MRIGLPRDACRHIRMFVERRVRNVRSPHIPHVYTIVDDQCAAGNVIHSLWPPLDASHHGNCVYRMLERRPLLHVPDFDLLVATACGQPLLRRMPITCVYRATVCGELLLASVRSLQIPQLDGSVFRYGGKQVRHNRTEFDIAHTLRVAKVCGHSLFGANVEALDGAVLRTGQQ